MKTNGTEFLWRVPAALLAPMLIVSGYLVCLQSLFHGAGSHSATPGFFIGIAIGGWLLWSLPMSRIARIVCLLVYIPLAYVLLIPYSLWFIAVAFGGMVSGG